MGFVSFLFSDREKKGKNFHFVVVVFSFSPGWLSGEMTEILMGIKTATEATTTTTLDVFAVRVIVLVEARKKMLSICF